MDRSFGGSLTDLPECGGRGGRAVTSINYEGRTASEIERIKKRAWQVENYENYDKLMEKEDAKRLRKGDQLDHGGRRHIKFSDSIIFIEATARDDMVEVQRLCANGPATTANEYSDDDDDDDDLDWF